MIQSPAHHELSLLCMDSPAPWSISLDLAGRLMQEHAELVVRCDLRMRSLKEVVAPEMAESEIAERAARIVFG